MVMIFLSSFRSAFGIPLPFGKITSTDITCLYMCSRCQRIARDQSAWLEILEIESGQVLRLMQQGLE